MENPVDLTCGNCGAQNSLCLAEDTNDAEIIRCERCGTRLSTVGKLHARIAQEAAGLGTDELRDDHVPVGGPPFGETT